MSCELSCKLPSPKLNNLASRVDVSGVEFYACFENHGRGVKKKEYLDFCFKKTCFFKFVCRKWPDMVDLFFSCPGTKLNYLASGLDLSDAEFYACSEKSGLVSNELRDLEIFC